jgi:hypothetical protein
VIADWLVVAAGTVLVVLVVVVLSRQGSPASLSDHEGRRNRRADVMERPAGPDAEAMAEPPPGERPAAGGGPPLSADEPDGTPG